MSSENLAEDPPANPAQDPATRSPAARVGGDGTFQKQIEDIYFERDRDRGVDGTTLWFVEEVGELVRAIRRREPENLEEEFADVYAWLATLASLHGVNLEALGATKYGKGCPRCAKTPCSCP